MRLLAVISICALVVSCTDPVAKNGSDAKDANEPKVTTNSQGEQILKEAIESGEANVESTPTGGLKRYSTIYKDLTGALGMGRGIFGIFGLVDEGEEGSVGALNLSPAPSLPCDFDFSGYVDGADLEIWKTGYGTQSGAGPEDGDCDGNGTVDGRDFLMWQRVFGTSIYDFFITAPANPTLTSTPVIQWTESFGAFGYDLQIATDANCTNFVQNHYGLASLSHQIDPLPNGTYYLCVYADNPAASSALTSGANFVPTFLPAKNNGLPIVIDAPVLYQHKVFITNNTYSISAGAEPNPGASNFGGLSSADLQCTRRANAAGLVPGWNGTDRIYKALISTNTVNARDRVVIQGRVINMGPVGTEVLAENGESFWDGSIDNAVQYNEFGTTLAVNTPFWTGSDFNGYASSQNCQNWSQTISQIGSVGYSSATSLWFNQAQLPCGQARRLICIGPAEVQ